jgi:hypothetical protein
MIKLLKVLLLLIVGFTVFSIFYVKENYRSIPSCNLEKFDNLENVDIRLAYIRETNSIEPYKSNIEKDMRKVSDTVSFLPLVGKTSISLSAKSRYGYDFKSVTPGRLGEYNSFPNDTFLNMEEPIGVEHTILHEIGGHYLSGYNSKNLGPYLTESQINEINQAEYKLISSIKRYKEESFNNNLHLVTADYVDSKIRNGFKVSWEELINAANSYPAEVWNFPSHYIEFQQDDNVDRKAVEERADKELYADFTAYLIRALDKGVIDCSYKHPVLEIFKKIKIQGS